MPPNSTALVTMADAAKPQSQGEFILYTTLKIIGVLASIYFFLMGLDMMGSSLCWEAKVRVTCLLLWTIPLRV